MLQADPIADRQEIILRAAFQAFATYGYRRTSMDDIAQGCGISRTALYLHYRNKEDIFRTLAMHHFEEAALNMKTELNRAGQSLKQALYACFVAKDGKFMGVVLTTPHGTELLDAGFSISGDLAMAGEAAMTFILAGWLQEKGLPPDLGPASDFAETVLAALKGLKSSAKSLEALRAGEDRLAGLIAKALTIRS